MNTHVNAKTNQNHKEVLFVVLSICQPMSSTTGTCEVAILDFCFYEKVFLSLCFISVSIFSTYRANSLVFLLII